MSKFQLTEAAGAAFRRTLQVLLERSEPHQAGKPSGSKYPDGGCGHNPPQEGDRYRTYVRCLQLPVERVDDHVVFYPRLRDRCVWEGDKLVHRKVDEDGSYRPAPGYEGDVCCYCGGDHGLEGRRGLDCEFCGQS